MATSATASGSSRYAYQKPSTLATRTLLSGDQPSETVTSSSHDAGPQDKPILQRRTTNHYAEAVAAATQTQPAAAPATPDESAVRPGLDRQQSWKMQDLKREHAERMLGGQMPGGGMGYSSTTTK